MDKAQFSAMCILLFAIAAFQAAPLIAPARTAPKYEYLIKGMHDATFEDDLNKIGGGGWELVFARRAMDEHTAGYEVIFRRPM